MTANDVITLFNEVKSKRKGIDKEDKEKIKEILDAVGTDEDFFQSYHVESILLMNENDFFDKIEVAEAVMSHLITKVESFDDLEKLVLIIANKTDGKYNPGFNDKERAKQVLSESLNKLEIDSFDYPNIMMLQSDVNILNDKESAINTAKTILEKIDDCEVLISAAEIAKSEQYLNSSDLSNQLIAKAVELSKDSESLLAIAVFYKTNGNLNKYSDVLKQSIDKLDLDGVSSFLNRVRPIDLDDVFDALSIKFSSSSDRNTIVSIIDEMWSIGDDDKTLLKEKFN